MKKRAKHKISNGNTLKEALVDISKELRKLKREKEDFIKKIELIEKSLQYTQYKEGFLRDRITKLIAEESNLSKRKAESLNRINSIKDKIGKIKKAEEELKQI